jgi:hypothetical protein
VFDSKTYYIENKEKINKRNSVYKASHPEVCSKHFKKYRLKNRDRLNEYYKNRYSENRELFSGNILRKQKGNLKSWEGYIPKETNCEICGITIYFNKPELKKAIHFDHKSPDVAIKTRPTFWLRSNPKTPENQAIWESCDFGMLCRNCNTYLPTKNRRQFIINVSKYVLAKEEK